MMEFVDFAAERLPFASCRLLEIGCGDGELARNLADRGFDVTAIDPHAPLGQIFQRCSFEDFNEPGPYDAVIASRSLHHISNLSTALEKVGSLLAPVGLFILNEFGWEQADERVVRWYRSHAPARPSHESLPFEGFPHRWIAEHEDLHDSATMRHALAENFHELYFEWLPYVSVYYLERPDLYEEERALIDAGEINPLGFRYVGTRRQGEATSSNPSRATATS